MQHVVGPPTTRNAVNILQSRQFPQRIVSPTLVKLVEGPGSNNCASVVDRKMYQHHVKVKEKILYQQPPPSQPSMAAKHLEIQQKVSSSLLCRNRMVQRQSPLQFSKGTRLQKRPEYNPINSFLSRLPTRSSNQHERIRHHFSNIPESALTGVQFAKKQ